MWVSLSFILILSSVTEPCLILVVWVYLLLLLFSPPVWRQVFLVRVQCTVGARQGEHSLNVYTSVTHTCSTVAL